MVGNYGMGNELKVFYNENIDSKSFTTSEKYSEWTKEKMDSESLDLINDAYQQAINILLDKIKSIRLVE
jgi:ATP-dependent Zn protease